MSALTCVIARDDADDDADAQNVKKARARIEPCKWRDRATRGVLA